MKLLVISSAPIIHKNDQFFMYAPYQKEMKIWAKYADEIQFCCPVWKEDKNLLIDKISFPISETIELKEFDITSFSKIPKAILYTVLNFFTIYKAMQKAEHIHLRCPGNMTLIASIVQVFFPKKKKTAKYAGNWDPKSKQPWSYRLQKWILSNTFLTKNMQVLVYGDWPNQTKNIKPFFTATYSKSEIQNGEILQKNLPSPNSQFPTAFLFVGTLSLGKQPLYAIQIVEALYKKGHDVSLIFYGDGVLRKQLELYIQQNKLDNIIKLEGNQSKETILKAYQNSHFLILPSKSEGWPKVVAEAMVWGCVPIATPVSCVTYMLGNGARGIVLNEKLDEDVMQIKCLLHNGENFKNIVEEAKNWSRAFTTDKFEEQIKKLLVVN